MDRESLREACSGQIHDAPQMDPPPAQGYYFDKAGESDQRIRELWKPVGEDLKQYPPGITNVDQNEWSSERGDFRAVDAGQNRYDARRNTQGRYWQIPSSSLNDRWHNLSRDLGCPNALQDNKSASDSARC